MTTTDPASNDAAAPPPGVPSPTGRPKPLAYATQIAYRRDWALFTDWCTATGQQPLPASPSAIQAYLDATGDPPTSRRRLVAAINDAHHQARQPLPQLSRSPRPHPWPDVDVPAILRRIPLWGWPTGMFGRRDAMLLLVRVQAGFTLSETIALTADQVGVNADRTLQLAAIQLAPTDDPRTCPACIWLRWRTMLNHARRFTTAAELHKRLASAPAGEQAHRCEQPPPAVLRGPVLPPINQWGAMPLPLRPATTRTITTLTGAHTRGTPPRHTPRELPPSPTELSASTAQHPVTEVHRSDPRTPEQIYRDGLAARRRDHHALADLANDFDDLDTAANELQQRLDLLLTDLNDTHDRAVALRLRR